MLGRPLLEALSLECHSVLSAAAVHNSGTVDVSALLASEADSCSDRASRILNGEFQDDGGANDTGLDEKDDCGLDPGPEDAEGKKKTLRARTQEAKEYGLYTSNCTDPEKLLRQSGDAIKLNRRRRLDC